MDAGHSVSVGDLFMALCLKMGSLDFKEKGCQCWQRFWHPPDQPYR